MELRNRELISHSNVANWCSLPTIAAERITLRWIEDTDQAALYNMFSDPEVMRYWSSLPLRSKEEAKRLVAEIHEGFQHRRFFQWGIACKTDNQLIGTATLFYLDSNNLRAEIGYALVRPEWGKGFMREALQALLGFAFHELNLQRIEADVDPRNLASAKLLRALGFQKEGLLRERWRATGEVQDSEIYGLLRREWNDGNNFYRVRWPAETKARSFPYRRLFPGSTRRYLAAGGALLTDCWRFVAAIFN